MSVSNPSLPEHRLALPAGYALEDYRILKVLGQGGFGITYLAEDIRMDLQVAIKELLPTDFATRHETSKVVPLTESAKKDFAWAKERFIDEAGILIRLNHPNIVRVFRLFEMNGTAYLVMQFVTGKTLREWMHAHPKPTEAELKTVLFPLLDGLEYVHRQGYLHRDISPENIKLTEDGYPVLLDFGSARALTGSRTTVIRQGFSPIEQYQSTVPQGPYTDLYALAGVMIRAITGSTPPQAIDRFDEPDPYQPLAQRLRGRYSDPLLKALDLAFAARPQSRPQTVAAWRRMLAASPAQPLPKPPAPIPGPPPVPKPDRDRLSPQPTPEKPGAIERQPQIFKAALPWILGFIAGAHPGTILYVAFVIFLPDRSSTELVFVPWVSIIIGIIGSILAGFITRQRKNAAVGPTAPVSPGLPDPSPGPPALTRNRPALITIISLLASVGSLYLFLLSASAQPAFVWIYLGVVGSLASIGLWSMRRWTFYFAFSFAVLPLLGLVASLIEPHEAPLTLFLGLSVPPTVTVILLFCYRARLR
jgi:serine/threonine protein kinase